MNKIIKILSLFLLAYIFNACSPYMLVKEIEKQQEELEQIKERKKTYRSGKSSFDIKDINEYIYINEKFNENDSIPNELFPALLNIIQIDDSNFPDEVNVKAIVTDTTGKYIKGLADPYFNGIGSPYDYWISVFDSCNGINKQIDNYSIKEIRENIAEPYAIHFVLDHSPSMGNQKVRYLQRTIKSVLFAIKDMDYVAITKFAKELHHEVNFTNDKKTYIDSFKVNGIPDYYKTGTAYYDAMISAINSFEAVPDSFKKVIISFTDGGDNSSSSDADSVKLLSKEKNVEIYSIAYGYANKIIKEIAEYSNGRYYYLISSKEFPYVFRDIYLLLNNYYEITFNPPDCRNLHKVKINLKFPSINMENLSDIAYYDKSIFNKNSPVGTKAIANIEFDTDSDVIKENSNYKIKEIADILLQNKNIKLKIIGHTDKVGDENYNLDLSKRRAVAVKNALIEFGINENRLITTGKGESNPLVPNNSETNRRKNRRTEFIIIK